MMLRSILLLTVLVFGYSMNTPAAEQSWLVLCYHDVRDNDSISLTSDSMSISTDELVLQFAWLKEHGYRPISLDDIRDAKAGLRPLPDKAVLLTFDDGYKSFYTKVFPLLKLFDYPAVLALVGKWMEGGPEDVVRYGKHTIPRKEFITWQQAKEIASSGLVEIASHSYDLHKGITGNPHDNLQPAAVTRLYDKESGSYESDDDYSARIIDDLIKNRELIYQKTGVQPRALVWPFGAYSRFTVDMAKQAGFDFTLTLSDGVNTLDDSSAMKRLLLLNGAVLSDMIWTMYHPDGHRHIRVVHVDLDYIYDEDPAQQEENLDKLLDRIKTLQISTVYLQAYEDADGDGNADALYFPNTHLPMRADLFNRVAWQLRTRSNVRVYAWLPVLAFRFPDDHDLSKLMVQSANGQEEHYHRLSPFRPETKQVVMDIYRSLAKHANFAGLLFHDDAMLDDYEDASPWALQYYQDEWGLPASISEIRKSKALFDIWSRNKTQLLIDLTNELTEVVRDYRPLIKTARNIYARVVLEPEAEARFAQSFPAFLDNYDYTAVMAMPYMEKAENHKQWLQDLLDRVSAIPGALDRTVFELQSVDWSDNSRIDSATLVQQMYLLQKNGAFNFGYYPDDFILDHPEIDIIRPVISLSVYPYR